ncbi:MAG: hypothetical protein ACFFCD_03800 [Promethearchaeota archaeon]
MKPTTDKFVTIKGEKFFVENGTLKLRKSLITDITEIEGLEHLTNLQTLRLWGNPIRKDETHLIRIWLTNAQKIVQYCQEKEN